MPEKLKLTPEERERVEALRDRPVPRHPLEKHPYEVDGYRARIGKKAEVRAEVKRMRRVRDAWAALDPATRDVVRWMTAERVVEMLAASSNRGVAGAVSASSEGDIARLRAEIAEAHRFEETGDSFEVADECGTAPGEGLGPLEPPEMLDRAETALRLPPKAAEKIPNLRAVVAELYAIWRRDKPAWRRDQRGVPKVGREAVEHIGLVAADLFDLPLAETQRRVRAILLDLDERDQLPIDRQ